MKARSAPLLTAMLATAASSAPYTAEQISAGIKQNGGPQVFIQRIASETAKMAGQRLDDQTEIIGAAALDGILVYYVRLINYSKAEIQDLQALRRQVASRNAPAVCAAPSASVLINEFSSEYKYVVYSKMREHLFEYSFTKASCAKNYRW